MLGSICRTIIARSKAYRWNEDGLAGICDRHQYICFAIALWNGRDPILKERLFGLTGNEGNHGEDVKECYFYLDSTPTHSYMKYLYKYPHAAFPYSQLVEENRRRDKRASEFELIDSGVFAENRYFDVTVEYAKDTAGRHPGAHQRDQSRSGARGAASAADDLVSQYMVVGRRGFAAYATSSRPVDRTRTPHAGPPPVDVRRRAGVAVHRERH